MLFYTGITRTADTILGEQKANIPDRLAQLQQLKDLAAEAVAGVRSEVGRRWSGSLSGRAGKPSGNWHREFRTAPSMTPWPRR